MRTAKTYSSETTWFFKDEHEVAVTLSPGHRPRVTACECWVGDLPAEALKLSGGSQKAWRRFLASKGRRP